MALGRQPARGALFALSGGRDAKNAFESAGMPSAEADAVIGAADKAVEYGVALPIQRLEYLGAGGAAGVYQQRRLEYIFQPLNRKRHSILYSLVGCVNDRICLCRVHACRFQSILCVSFPREGKERTTRRLPPKRHAHPCCFTTRRAQRMATMMQVLQQHEGERHRYR